MGIRDEIRKFIHDSFLVDEFADDASFMATGLIDSLGIGQLLAFVESNYAIRVPNDDLVPDNFDSVTRLTAYVQRRASEVQSA